MSVVLRKKPGPAICQRGVVAVHAGVESGHQNTRAGVTHGPHLRRSNGFDAWLRRSTAALVSWGDVLDIDPESFEEQRVKDAIVSAKTIFVNAVMGLMPSFFEGSQALYQLIASNGYAMKLFGGGDTLQELKNLCPGIYMAGLDAPGTYYFTGGGSVLAAIEQESPYGLKPVEALMEAV